MIIMNEQVINYLVASNPYFPCFFQSSSVSPSASFRPGEKHRSSSDYSDSKKQKTDDKDLASTRYVSDLKANFFARLI